MKRSYLHSCERVDAILERNTRLSVEWFVAHLRELAVVLVTLRTHPSRLLTGYDTDNAAR